MIAKNMAILNDVTKCIGCEQCVDACQEANGLPKEEPWRWVKRIDDLSSARWTTIDRRRSEKGDRFVRQQCLHCLDPSCVSVCIVGAMKKTPEGPVIYDKDICIGCRYCMIACPWEIPRYSWEDRVPYIQKCNMCYQRVLKEGKVPACVEACPTEATIFGDRDELLAEANRRITEEPGKYVHKIWGAKEVGGTRVLYVSDVELKLTGLDAPVVDTEPMPHRTTKILHQMPLVFTGMAIVMGGVYWIIKRRQQNMASPEDADSNPGESPESGARSASNRCRT
jgi:formate dehydrogenase iron-sulfur subunit